MLAQFTWHQFLIATLLLTLFWYVAVILIFYRKDLSDFLNGKHRHKDADPLAHRWEKGVDDLEDEAKNVSEDLLGKPKVPEGTSTVSMGKFGFAKDDEAKAQQIGLVPDVLQELKTVFAILEKEDGNKKDFFNLMEVVRQKYGQIGSNPNIGRINEFISAHAPFHLSPEELENLWD